MAKYLVSQKTIGHSIRTEQRTMIHLQSTIDPGAESLGKSDPPPEFYAMVDGRDA